MNCWNIIKQHIAIKKAAVALFPEMSNILHNPVIDWFGTHLPCKPVHTLYTYT
jgi:hypothetical protein